MIREAVFAAIAVIAITSGSHSATAAEVNHLMVPQSIRYEHNAIIERLAKEAAKTGVAAAVAQRALVLVKSHFAKEDEFVFPPLGLLDQIAAGEMPGADVKKAAIEMADRTKAAQGDLSNEHAQLDALMNELIQAAKRAEEPGLVAFATDLAAHSLHEIEILEPTTIMIGKYLQPK